MDPSEITLETTRNLFTYEKISRDLEKCDDVVELRNICRCYFKLYLKQQEVLKEMHMNFSSDIPPWDDPLQ